MLVFFLIQKFKNISYLTIFFFITAKFKNIKISKNENNNIDILK